MQSIGLWRWYVNMMWRWYINMTITILDIIHRPVFYSKNQRFGDWILQTETESNHGNVINLPSSQTKEKDGWRYLIREPPTSQTYTYSHRRCKKHMGDENWEEHLCHKAWKWDDLRYSDVRGKTTWKLIILKEVRLWTELIWLRSGSMITKMCLWIE
jgi:hypothetical protein